MNYKGYRHIPRALFDAIKFLAQALPKRSVPTFLELFFGAMTDPVRFCNRRHSGGRYCKAQDQLLQVAPLRKEVMGRLGRQMARMVLNASSPVAQASVT